MNRYLLNFSYIGTPFRGLQKQIVNSEGYTQDINTIQGCIEIALDNLHLKNRPVLVLSSRTDKGVHALSNYAHVDLETLDGKDLKSDKITFTLNKTFQKKNFPIRILRTFNIPNSFHSRYNAKHRTYLYRIAVSNQPRTNQINKNTILSYYLPIEDISRCFYIQNKVDVEHIIRNVEIFKGRHDFRTFMSTSKNNEKQKNPMSSLRTILDIRINQTVPPINSFEYNKAVASYNYWDIEITGVSFLYKQVRRIVGTLLALGTGLISENDVYEMLTIPSKFTWNSKAVVAPAHALYLCDVHYDDIDLQFKNIDNTLLDKNESSGTNIKQEK